MQNPVNDLRCAANGALIPPAPRPFALRLSPVRRAATSQLAALLLSSALTVVVVTQTDASQVLKQ
jgi:hypothetical protein